MDARHPVTRTYLKRIMRIADASSSGALALKLTVCEPQYFADMPFQFHSGDSQYVH
jgi:hypothetical protein